MELAKSLAVGPQNVPIRETVVSLGSGQSYLVRCVRVKTGAVVTIEDISDVEFLQRVRSWVPVAQKLAHGIKTPLSAVMLSLQRLEKHSDSDGQRYIDGVRTDIERLRKMTDGFMRVTRLEPPKLVPQDINALLRECLAKFERAKPAGITFQSELEDGLPLIAIDKEQFSDAIASLLDNAVAAMTSGSEQRAVSRGEQRAVNSEQEGDEKTLRVVTTLKVKNGPDLKPVSRDVEIAISDTGPGIPEGYLAKVFEPYFTTKIGGTGLGMYITKKIIEEHKGSIAVESHEGKGTRVIIRLPVGG